MKVVSIVNVSLGVNSSFELSLTARAWRCVWWIEKRA